MKNIIIFIIFIIISSCSTKKVALSKEEKKLITINEKQKFIYENDEGIRDTVFIVKATALSAFEKRLAIKFEKAIYNDSADYATIPFEKSYITPFSFERGEFKKKGVNLSIKLIFSKMSLDQKVTLKIQPFSEEYDLNENSNKEYIFEKNSNYNPELCKTSVLGCLKKVIYTKENGITLIEKADTGIWKLIKRIE